MAHITARLADKNGVTHLVGRSTSIAARVAVVLLSIVLVGCSALDEELVTDWSTEAEQALVAEEIDADVVTCVLRIAADDLERGPLSAAETDELVRSCQSARDALKPVIEDAVPDTELALTDIAWNFGDDSALDELWSACEEGSGSACDDLFEQSPLGSAYEEFGVSCGDRPDVLHCSELDQTEE